MVNICTVEHNAMKFNQFITKPNAMNCLNTLGAVGGLFLVSLIRYCGLENERCVKKVSLFSKEVKMLKV